MTTPDYEAQYADREARIDAISNILMHAGAFTGESKRRIELAHRLVVTQSASSEDMNDLVAYVTSRKGLTDPGRFLADMLLNRDWKEILAEWRAAATVREASSKVQEPDRPPSDHRTDDIEWASASNPYGWRRDVERRLHRAMDFDEAGVWNPFRSTWNLTTEEARKLGRTGMDYKVRGCTRWAYLGPHGKPTPEWDPACLRVANEVRGPVEPVAAADTSGEPVYGESPDA